MFFGVWPEFWLEIMVVDTELETIFENRLVCDCCLGEFHIEV